MLFDNYYAIRDSVGPAKEKVRIFLKVSCQTISYSYYYVVVLLKLLFPNLVLSSRPTRLEHNNFTFF